MSSLLVSSVTENALIYDGAVQDCSTSAAFIFNVEEEATTLVLNIVGEDVPNMVLLSDPNRNRINVPDYTSFMDQNTITLSIGLNKTQYRATPWSLSVRTTSGPCFVQVRAVSPLTVIPGFTSIMSNDYPAESPFSTRGSDHHAYTVLRVPNNSYTVDQISIGPGDVANPWTDATSLQSVQALPRDTASCSYQYISEKNVEMPTSNLVRMEVSGHTSTSAWYQRTFYFEQINVFASVCNHGQANMYGECVCADGYSGQFCDLPPCRNGATRSMTVCLCATGYYGQLCENRIGGFEPITTTTTTPITITIPLQPTPGSSAALNVFVVFFIVLGKLLL
ncbi:unnamed protein product [Cylicocyclus nassatus]|uniref:EGF-like domain-containing protein n=1 Tax=Cylicocyclus nassatus TaxID=53992 RepID=A0AA36DW24_CYLNA|nr:unnamed protein product [Cylicocyclus nassatus]